MANQLKNGARGSMGVIIVDTAADNIVAATLEVTIRKIRWVGSTTAADSATVMEAGGSVAVWESGPVVAGTIGFTDETEFETDAPLKLMGLKVGAITHGKLYIYVD